MALSGNCLNTLLLLVLCGCFSGLQSAKHFNRNNGSPGHLLLAPSSFLSGTSNKICISRFGSATIGTATAQIELLTTFSNPSDKTRHLHKFIARARKVFPDGNGGCVELFVPKTLHRKALLRLRMRFDSLPNYKINNRKEVRIQHDNNIVIIQTDKPLYRGGDVVKFRIVQLKTDLTPQYGPIYRVYIEAPSDIFGGPVKIAQWFNVTSQMGYIQREYTLDKYARKGDWKIVVDSRDPSVASTIRTFHVTNYKLPKFYISVNYQENILLTFDELFWNVCVRHMYGEAADGELYINTKSDSYGYPPIHFSTKLRELNGCYNYTLKTQLLGFQEKNDNKPTVIITDISFQEADTKMWKNTTAISHVQEKMIYIDFLNNNQYFKPGLPHKIKVKVSDWNGAGVSGAKVEFCKNYNDNIKSSNIMTNNDSQSETSPLYLESSHKNDCGTKLTDVKGFASFAFTVSYNVEYIYLKSTVLDHPLHEFETDLQKENSTSVLLKLYSWGNKTKINMNIGSPIKDSSDMRFGKKYIFPIFLKFDNGDIMRQITLHHLVVTRSGTISSWGTSSQCIHPIHDVQNIETIFGPSVSRNDCLDESYSESGVFKMMLNIKVSHLMCPHSYIIAYFVRPNGEIIVANKLFEAEDCFFNKLTQQWIPNVVSPSTEAKLQLNSVGPALCMVNVKNVAFNLVAPQYSVYNDLLDKINLFMDLRHNRTDVEAMNNICFSDNFPKIHDDATRLYFWNSIKDFLMSDLEILSDVLPALNKCPDSNTDYKNEKPAELFFSKYNKPLKERIFFPETWLWDIRLMNTSGVLDISTTVPDDITNWESEAFCITRSGIASTVPNHDAMLKVFQPFFIELSTPNTIKRSEHVQMFYKIYNYLDQDLPVVFDIEVVPSAAATIISHEGTTNRIYCILGKKSLTTHFTVKAHQLRPINITVTAYVKSNMQQLCSSSPTLKYIDIRDKIVKTINVEPEGIPVENHKSTLLCINDSTNKTEFSWNFERKDSVPQSEDWFISLVGDITGPMTMNVEKLVSMPMGCGEQNMVLLAYNLIALEYSMVKKRTSGETKDAALNYLLIGYQRQLNYYHSDTGAFSAFGRSDESGSTWLTAFSLKYLSNLHQRWNIGSYEIINATSKWLLDKQMENGCFRNEGQVFHKEMKGGLKHESSSVALASYIIISILDGNIPNMKLSTIIDASYCLAGLNYSDLKEASEEFDRGDAVYTFAIATLAQVKIEKYLNSLNQENDTHTQESSRKNTDLMQSIYNKNIKFLTEGASNTVNSLKNMAHKNGELIWWEAGSLSVSIETTAYAILSLLLIGGEDNIMYSIAAARWLSMHRNDKGGFISTQDTLIAVEALCALRHAMPDIPPSMNVVVEGPGRGRHFTVSPSERHKLHIVMMKSIDTSSTSSTKLKIKAQGKGCLLVQATQKYNRYHSVAQLDSSFGLYVKTTTDGTFNCKSNESWCMCAAILEICINWNDPSGLSFPEMAILEIEMPTGYSPDRPLLYQLIKRENVLLRRIEESQDENFIYIYLSVPLESMSYHPSECFNLYLLGPASQTAPASIKIYDYYNRDTTKTKTYMISEKCPFEWYRTPLHHEPLDIKEELIDSNDTETINQNWHIIDSSQDLDVPKTMEGVPPVYELPPSNFNYTDVDVERDANQEQTFTNWTFIDSEMDLDFPTGDEGNDEVWEII